MMDTKRERLVVLFTLMAFCELTAAMGFCKFGRMFPSQGKLNGTTSDNVAKVRDHMSSLTSTKNQADFSTSTNQSPKMQNATVKDKSTVKSGSQAASNQTSPSGKRTTEQLTSTPPTSPPCATNMVLGLYCECDRTCQDPISCNCTGGGPEMTCVCPEGFLMKNEECVAESECGCYYEGGGIVIPDGTTYVKDDCTERCNCSGNYLSCDSTYTCSPNAECTVKDGVQQCYCKAGYVGDGMTCEFRDCYDAYEAGFNKSGVYTILPSLLPSKLAFEVYCDMNTDDGGWTVFQRRTDQETDFYRNWTSYKIGFGSFNNGKDFWLGNEKLHYLTQQGGYDLRVDRIYDDGEAYTTTYDSFKIGDESENYQLSDLGSKGGNGGDGMSSAEGMPFSTYDRDSLGCDCDGYVEQRGGGGWWYSKEKCSNCQSTNADCSPTFHCCGDCYQGHGCSNLNGKHGRYNNDNDKMSWTSYCNYKSVEMKIRPKI